MLLGMAVTMTVPMVARCATADGWRGDTEMAASMVLPMFAAIGLVAANVLTDIGTLLVVEHFAMLLGMLVAMVLRLDDDYTQHHSHAHADVHAHGELAAA